MQTMGKNRKIGRPGCGKFLRIWRMKPAKMSENDVGFFREFGEGIGCTVKNFSQIGLQTRACEKISVNTDLL